MFDYSRFYEIRTPLHNTLACLRDNKKLNVLYFGGSVTMGVGLPYADMASLSWRAKTGEYIAARFPNAEINSVNRAVGESGTYLGCFRVERDVIAHKPDLLFIEYSINDCYFGSSYEESAMRFETIVREVRKALPFCDIVTVLVTDKRRSDDALEGRLHAQAQAHDDVAAAYGIPSVKAGLALAAKYGEALHARWSDFFTDIVHMTAAGYDEYYQCIEAYLGSALAEGNIGEKKAHTLPPLFSETLFDGDRQTLQATNNLLQKSEALGGFGFSFSEKYFGLHDYNGYFYAEQGGENPVLALEFAGTEIAICSNVATGVAREESVWCFAVSVDGGEWQRRNFKTHNPTMLAENLPAGRHEIKFQPLFETFEKDEAFKLGIIFTRNAETQSHK